MFREYETSVLPEYFWRRMHESMWVPRSDYISWCKKGRFGLLRTSAIAIRIEVWGYGSRE